MNPIARRIVVHSSMTLGSKISPTDTRKVGMNKVPIKGSTPTSSATTAEEVRPMNTRMYRSVRSCPSPVKNHRAIAGNTRKQ